MPCLPHLLCFYFIKSQQRLVICIFFRSLTLLYSTHLCTLFLHSLTQTSLHASILSVIHLFIHLLIYFFILVVHFFYINTFYSFTLLLAPTTTPVRSSCGRWWWRSCRSALRPGFDNKSACVSKSCISIACKCAYPVYRCLLYNEG